MGINEDKLFEMSVTATPHLGSRKTFVFSNDTSDTEITDSTIPLVAKSNVEGIKKHTQDIIGNVKSLYTRSENDPEVQSGATVCHGNVHIKLPFDGGIWELDIKEVPEPDMNSIKSK